MNILRRAIAFSLKVSMRRGRAAAGTVALLAAATACEAQVILPPATGTFNYDVSLNVGVPASHSFACGTVSITGVPLPVLSAAGSGCTSVLQAILTYSFEIVGATNVLVPFNVSSTAMLDANGSAQAGYSLSVAGQVIGIDNCYFGSLTSCGTKTTTTAMSLMSNQVYTVGMMTAASNFLGAGAASAVLDPMFSIDDLFALNHDFTFVFSPGIGNGPTVTVPEPQTSALMLVGLALGAALVGRRRRRESGFASRRQA